MKREIRFLSLVLPLLLLSSGTCSFLFSQEEGAAPVPMAGAADVVPAQWKDAGVQGKSITLAGDEPGNWYRKRHILKEARKVYELLTKQIVALLPEREKFEKIRSEDLDKKFDAFYQECGFQQGFIDEQLNSIGEEIKQTQESVGMLDADRKNFLKQLEEKRTELTELKKEFSHVQKLDAAANEGIKTLNEEINRAQGYEAEAWEQYQKIADTLNDEVAEDLYRRIEASLRNTQALERYIKNDIVQFFATLSSDVDKQIGVVKGKIEALRAKGVELNKKVLDERIKQEALKREQERLKKISDQKALEEKKLKDTWSYKARSFFTGAWNTVRGWTVSSYKAVRGLFVSSK